MPDIPIILHHTPTDTNTPALLYAGETAVATGPTRTKLWVGDGTTNRLLLSTNRADNPLLIVPALPLAVTDGGIPAGGARYQVLGKVSGTARDVAWQDVGARPNNNTFIGTSTPEMTIGTNNTAVGNTALFAVMTGSDNVGIGYFAGGFAASPIGVDYADNSIFIGSSTAPAERGQTNQIVIGANAVGRGSNTVTLGTDAITQLWCGGRDLLAATSGGPFLPLTGGVVYQSAGNDPLTIRADPALNAQIAYRIDNTYRWVAGALGDGTFRIGDLNAAAYRLTVNTNGSVDLAMPLSVANGGTGVSSFVGQGDWGGLLVSKTPNGPVRSNDAVWAGTWDDVGYLYVYSASNLYQATYVANRCRGTPTAPTALQSGDIIGGYYFQGFPERTGGGGMCAQTECRATQDWTAANQGTRLVFATTRNNMNTLQYAMILEENGWMTLPSGGLTVSGSIQGAAGATFDSGFAYGPVRVLTTNNPAVELYNITGTLPANDGGLWRMAVGAAGNWQLQKNTTWSIDFSTQTNMLRVTPNGDCFNTTGTWAALSDRRVKTGIAPYRSGLAEILRLPAPVTYAYNGRGGTLADGRRRVGLIADEVFPAMPELVGETMVQLDPGDSADTTLRTLDPGLLVYALINSVKELAGEVAQLKEQIHG